MWNIARRGYPPPQSPWEGVLTDDAADRRGVSIACIHRAIHRGELIAWKGGGWWRIDPHSLRTWQPRRRTR